MSLITTLAHIEHEHHERIKREVPRGHLGLSQIYSEDQRALWLQWRWSLPNDITPRVMRLFDLGHKVEDLIVQVLRETPGMIVETHHPHTGKQHSRLFLDGHVGGSVDGIIRAGVTEMPRTTHILECKSANDKSFRKLVDLNSYKAWNATYYGQIQSYMGAFEIPWALVVVMNKNDSALYIERIEAEKGWIDEALEIAHGLMLLTEPPKSPYKPTDYQIKRFKGEQWQRVYWGKELPRPNCRNCKHLAPVSDDDKGTWRCDRWQRKISTDEQWEGCELHIYMPCFMPGTLIEDHDTTMRYDIEGVEVWNSEDHEQFGESHVYPSTELHALSVDNALTGAMLRDPMPQKIRAAFGGEFVAED